MPAATTVGPYHHPPPSSYHYEGIAPAGGANALAVVHTAPTRYAFFWPAWSFPGVPPFKQTQISERISDISAFEPAKLCGSQPFRCAPTEVRAVTT